MLPLLNNIEYKKQIELVKSYKCQKIKFLNLNPYKLSFIRIIPYALLVSIEAKLGLRVLPQVVLNHARRHMSTYLYVLLYYARTGRHISQPI